MFLIRLFVGIAMVVAGVTHFIFPKSYGAFLPVWVGFKPEIVLISGLAEVLVGAALLYGPTAWYGAMALLIMMVGYLPIHVYHISDPPVKLGLPYWIFPIRAFLQLALIYGSYLLTKAT
jgi:uncharacterized membrane protein